MRDGAGVEGFGGAGARGGDGDGDDGRFADEHEGDDAGDVFSVGGSAVVGVRVGEGDGGDVVVVVGGLGGVFFGEVGVVGAGVGG